MDAIVLLAIAGASLAVSLFTSVGRRRSRLQTWRKAAELAGLAGIEMPAEGVFAGGQVRARSGPLSVELTLRRDVRGTRTALLTVAGIGPAAGGLSLRRRNLGTTLRRLLGEEIRIGAPELDDRVALQGPMTHALAVLDAETRHRVARLLEGAAGDEEVQAALADGKLEVWFQDHLPAHRLARVIGAALDVARRLAPPADFAGRIAENLRTEPEPGVRLQAVRSLARELPAHPATRPALLAARLDPSEEVRLEAAVALGEWGHEILRDLAENAGDEHGGRAVRALAESPGGLDPEDAAALLQSALAAGRGKTSRACLDVLGRHGRAESEPVLLEALASPLPEVATAAAWALGRAGTVAAVAPLREAAEGVLGPELDRTVREAIAAIQARLTGAERGQLSVAALEAGALSLPTEEHGRLTLASTDPPTEDTAWPQSTGMPQQEG